MGFTTPAPLLIVSGRAKGPTTGAWRRKAAPCGPPQLRTRPLNLASPRATKRMQNPMTTG